MDPNSILTYGKDTLDYVDVLKYGLGGIGVFGILMLIFSKGLGFLSKRNIQNHENTVQNAIPLINNVTQKQTEVLQKIDALENVEKDKKEEIKKIIEDTNQEVNEALNSSSLNMTNNSVRSKWEELQKRHR